MSKFKNNKHDNRQRHYINRQIRAAEVLCIDHNNEKLGVIPTSKAMEIAISNELDLVQMSSTKGQVICKILDYGKFKYEQSKKQKAIAKKQREQSSKIKEIKFRPCTGANDLQTKAKQALAFLESGHKVKISILFKGREMSHKEIAYDTLDEFLSMIPDIQIIKSASIEGRALSIMTSKA